jgi:hypothetical protein
VGAFLVGAALLGLIPAVIAKGKGRSFAGWWLFGALLFIVALPAALIVKDADSDRYPCPHCAEMIKFEAQVCPFCRGDVDD